MSGELQILHGPIEISIQINLNLPVTQAGFWGISRLRKTTRPQSYTFKKVLAPTFSTLKEVLPTTFSTSKKVLPPFFRLEKKYLAWAHISTSTEGLVNIYGDRGPGIL